MEMVSFLAGEEWSDMPECSHPVISRTAQKINDSLDDSKRHLILSQFDRLFGTSDPRYMDAFEDELKIFLTDLFDRMTFCDYTGEPIYPGSAYYYIVRSEALDALKYAQSAASHFAFHIYYGQGAEAAVQFLSDILDIYDRVSGRTQVEPKDVTVFAEHPSQVKAGVSG